MQRINLNLIPGGVRPVVNVSQYDEGRQFKLAIFNGSASYDLTDKTVTIKVGKLDGNGVAYDDTDEVHDIPVVAVSGNIVTITTTIQMTPVAGDNMAELQIEDSVSVIGTLNFILSVEPSALSPDTPLSDTQIPAIERAGWDAVVKYPRIDPVTNHWLVWSVTFSDWVDTGVNAGGGGVTDYGDLTSKPQINEVQLIGNRTAAELGLATDDVMTGATSGTAGAKGLVPAPSAGDQSKSLRGDGTWQTEIDTLAGLTDTNISSPADGQILKYDAGSSKWINSNGGGGGAGALSDLSDVDIDSMTNGEPLTYDSTDNKWINGGIIPAANGGTGNNSGYIRAGMASGFTVATGVTIEGRLNAASADYSHAEGQANIIRSTAPEAHAEGFGNEINGFAAHAEGASNKAVGDCSHVSGNSNEAGYANQTVIGKYNKNASDSLFEIGNGTGTALANRSNAIAVKSDGRIIKGANNAFPAASNLAPVEMTRTMTASHAAGSYLYVAADDQFYQVGATALSPTNILTPGTNATAKSVGEVLSALNGSIASISGDLTDIIKVKNISHQYTIDSAGGCHWNPTNDTGFSETGYTPLGIIGYISDTTTTYFTSLWSESMDWSMMMHGTPGATGTVQYKVLYLKNLS